MTQVPTKRCGVCNRELHPPDELDAIDEYRWHCFNPMCVVTGQIEFGHWVPWIDEEPPMGSYLQQFWGVWYFWKDDEMAEAL